MADKGPLKIVLVAPEIYPQIKVGGLGQFVAGMVKNLRRQSIVKLITPSKSIYGPLNSPVTQNRFNELADQAYFSCVKDGFCPQIIWANDWSGVAVLKRFADFPAKKIWTIHSPIEGDYYYQYENQAEDEPVDWSGDFFDFKGMVKEGLDLADRVNTVSVSYARELSGLLGRPIVGIPNGIDDDLWDAKADCLLKYRLDGSNWCKFKQENKSALQRELSLPVVNCPLFCFVSRLAEQKGIDLLFNVLPQFLGKNDLQWVAVGQGKRKYHRFFESLQRDFPGKVALRLEADFELPHQVFAGADFLVLPSRCEPFGLVVSEAMNYGVWPIVHLTGGLKDQVKNDLSGFGFENFKKDDLEEKLYQSLKLSEEKMMGYSFIQGRPKAFGWDRVALNYQQMFEDVLN